MLMRHRLFAQEPTLRGPVVETPLDSDSEQFEYEGRLYEALEGMVASFGPGLHPAIN